MTPDVLALERLDRLEEQLERRALGLRGTVSPSVGAPADAPMSS